MKTYFIGHGSPENALRDNAYTKYLHQLGTSINPPECIVVFSAHWLTQGSFITGNRQPQQIYDFYGFPQELYDIRYRPPGMPSIAEAISSQIHEIQVDYNRGIDHAAWAVVMHMFPDQNIPLLEMSLNIDLPESGHFDLGRRIAALGMERVLFIGSGNAVHNLGDIDFNEHANPFSWAIDTNDWLVERIKANDERELIEPAEYMPNYRLAVPTKDHYLPLLYVLGFRTGNTTIEFNAMQNGSISMLSFSVD